MGTLWFCMVSLMLTTYVIFDGFDLGVGVIYLFVARSEPERAQTLRSIGPIWDGNEVWLLATGGTLFFAFPLLYSSALSGFYLPVMIVLWLIIMRGTSIELRNHSVDPLWRTFFDGLFSFSSLLLTIFFGAALGNVLRGVPLGVDDYFFLPLWTDWRTGVNPGILDWYTVLAGALALSAISLHGALYVALKTEGEVERRACQFSRHLWSATVALTAVGIPATVLARPASLSNYTQLPLNFVIPVGVIISLGLMRFTMIRRWRLASFLASCGYLALTLAGAASALFPVLLPSVGTLGRDLTIDRAMSSPDTLRIGLAWWSVGICLAVMYFVIVYRVFRGKVPIDAAAYGH